jgi:predicted DNA-binding protein
MSEGEKTSSIRLPAEQEEFVKLMNEKYGFTRNNLIKMALLQFQKEYYPLLRNDIILPSEMTSNRDKGDIAKCNHSARRNDSKPSTPSRAPLLMSNYIDIYKVNSNSSIIFLSEKTQQAWQEWKKYRGIKKAQEKFQKRYIDKVLANETEAQLVERWERSISSGWKGFVFDNDFQDEQTNTTYSEDDL